MIEQWFKGWCPVCDSANWICNGDISDSTVMDVDGIQCWNCGKEFLLSEEEFYSHDDEEFPHNYQKGIILEEKERPGKDKNV